jgi:hypothetical protein
MTVILLSTPTPRYDEESLDVVFISKFEVLHPAAAQVKLAEQWSFARPGFRGTAHPYAAACSSGPESKVTLIG